MKHTHQTPMPTAGHPIQHDKSTSRATRWLLSHLDGGELGNRLVTYSYLLALALEHRAAFTNLGFWRYARFFELSDALVVRPWEPTPLTAAPSGMGRRIADFILRELRAIAPFERWVQRRCRFDGDVVFDTPALTRRALAFISSRLANSRVARPALERLIRFQHDGVPGRPKTALTLATLKGWTCPIDDPSVVERHSNAIRAHLRPARAIRDRVDAFLAPLRAQHRMLVGVHIRRGDYRIYRDGRWFFGDEIYRAVMEEFERRIGGDVGFVLASNDPVPAETFAPLQVTRAPGHLMLDMFSLAGCDYIAGPPSTFSGSASFLGAKPIFWMTDANARPTDLATLKPWVPQLY